MIINNQDNKVCTTCSTTLSSQCITYYGNSYLIPPLGTDTITLCYGTSIEQAVETICNSINVLNTNVTSLQAFTSTIYNQPVSNICYYGLQTSYNNFISCLQVIHNNNLSTNLSFILKQLDNNNNSIVGLQSFAATTLNTLNTLYNNSGKVLASSTDTGTPDYLNAKLTSSDSSVNGAPLNTGYGWKVNLTIPHNVSTIVPTPAGYTAIENLKTILYNGFWNIKGTIYIQPTHSPDPGLITTTIYNIPLITAKPLPLQDIYRTIIIPATSDHSTTLATLDGSNYVVGFLRYNSATGDITVKWYPDLAQKWASMNSSDTFFIPIDFSFNIY